MPNSIRQLRAAQPSHLPRAWTRPQVYQQLCAETIAVEQFQNYRTPWKEMRIPAGAEPDDVYRRLPSHLDFEYAGYLTKTRIRYRRCGRYCSYLPPKPCTFHSHPTALGRGEPDIPSATDIQLFLLNRSWRTITVGRAIIWVFEKTEATFAVIRQLAAWETDHLAPEARQLEARFRDWTERLAARGLAAIGIVIPNSPKTWAGSWPKLLQERLHFRVRILEREGTTPHSIAQQASTQESDRIPCD